MVNGYMGCPAEAELIDEVLGKLPEGQVQAIRTHLRQCPACCRLHRDWQALVGHPLDEASRQSSATASPIPPAPPRLRGNRRLRLHGHAAYQQIRQHTIAWRGVAVAAVFLLGLAGLWQMGREPHVGDPSAARVARAAGTRQVQVVPAAASVKGRVWVNDGRSEMLLLVDGLAPQDNTDYQVWSEGPGQTVQLGLLQWSGHTAMLHYQGDRIEQADRLSVSAEPKGGSDRPTGPELAWAALRP